MTPHSAQLISDYFLTHSNNPLTAMHMIKMTYIAHGFALAITKKPLIGSRIEAWKHGPVIPVLYRTYQGCGAQQVKSLNYSNIDFTSDKTLQSEKKYIESLMDYTTCNILDQVSEHFGCLPELVLSSLTHQNGTPWHQCYRPGKLFSIIPDNVIQAFYEKKMSNDDGQSY